MEKENVFTLKGLLNIGTNGSSSLIGKEAHDTMSGTSSPTTTSTPRSDSGEEATAAGKQDKTKWNKIEIDRWE